MKDKNIRNALGYYEEEELRFIDCEFNSIKVPRFNVIDCIREVVSGIEFKQGRNGSRINKLENQTKTLCKLNDIQDMKLKALEEYLGVEVNYKPREIKDVQARVEVINKKDKDEGIK